MVNDDEEGTRVCVINEGIKQLKANRNSKNMYK